MDEPNKKCAICLYSSNNTSDCLLFGDWMQKENVTVHYFCLLLSHHLPQNGKDCSGILGFLLRDIRKEIVAAAGRHCVFCHNRHASIRCQGCKDYFHLKCSMVNRCVSQFGKHFHTYCFDCLPLTAKQRAWQKSPPPLFAPCYICKQPMGFYSPDKAIYAPCCDNGFVHRNCMLKYALSAGYYLKCIWCRSVEFRELVRLQGVFVPDRDAQWERQKDAYRELQGGHRHCDAERCCCPRGRDYVGGKWEFINCGLCGSVGAHNPQCIVGAAQKQKLDVYKCEICSPAERQRSAQLNATAAPVFEENFETTLYQCKQNAAESQLQFASQAPIFSDEECSMSSKESSVVTVLLSDLVVYTASSAAAVVAAPIAPLLPEAPTVQVAVDALEEPLGVIDLCSQLEADDVGDDVIFVKPKMHEKCEDSEGDKDAVSVTSSLSLSVTDLVSSLSVSEIEITDEEDGCEEVFEIEDDKIEADVEVEADNEGDDEVEADDEVGVEADEEADDEAEDEVDEDERLGRPISFITEQSAEFCTETAAAKVTTATAPESIVPQGDEASGMELVDEVAAMSACQLTCTAAAASAKSVDKKKAWIDETDDSDNIDEAAMYHWLLTCTDFCPAAASKVTTAPQVDQVEAAQHTIEAERIDSPVENAVQQKLKLIQPRIDKAVNEAVRREPIEIVGTFATFWMYDFNDDNDEMHCTGRSKIRIDLSSPRFAGKTIEEIVSAENTQVTDDDVIETSDDISKFTDIDRIFDEYRD